MIQFVVLFWSCCRYIKLPSIPASAVILIFNIRIFFLHLSNNANLMSLLLVIGFPYMQ